MQAKKFNFILILLSVATVFFAVAIFNFNKVYAFSPRFIIHVNNKIYDFEGEELAYYKGQFYIKCLEDVVDYIYKDTFVAPVDATVSFNSNSSYKFSYTQEREGKAINSSKLISDINLALKKGEFEVYATFYEIPPNVTVSELKSSSYKRAEFSTEYKNSISARKSNIELAVKKINGTILKDGESFSFNKIVGERSEQNGFLKAVVIENGKFSEGVGGGVCQVSSTLYNVALLSGLKVTKRYAHSIALSYVEPSFDAMVSYGGSDLEFINSSGGLVFVEGVANGNIIKFTVYGKLPDCTYERISVITEQTPPSCEEIILDNELLVGERVFVQRAKNGIKSEGYLVVYKNGEKISITKLHSDVYKAVNAQIRVGTKPLE